MQSITETSIDDVVLNSTTDVPTNTGEIVKPSEIVPADIRPEYTFMECAENLYNYIKKVHTEKITPMNVVVIATELIQAVEKYKNLTGIQKKTMVLSVVKNIVNAQMDTVEDKRAMDIIIDMTLPMVIDGLVSAINGGLKFDKEKMKSFFRKFMCCC